MKTNIQSSFLGACAALLLAAASASAAIPANGTYNLVNRATGKYLDSYSSATNGDPARQYDQSWSAAQLWTLSSGSGYWKLMVNLNSMYLDSVGHTGNGSIVNLWTSSTSNNQRWVIEDLGTGYYRIKNVANGLYLDNLGSTTNGDDQYFWAGTTSYNQQWAFVSPGATFWSARTYSGTQSQEFPVGSYNTAAMVANGCADNSANSMKIWWPGFSVSCYDAGDLTGTPVVYTENTVTLPGIAGIMSSLKVQTGYPSGITYRSQPGQWVTFQVGYLFGTYELFHNGDNVQLKSSGSSKYTIRYETEYWVKSGVLAPPIVTVISGTNVLDHTSGSSDLGTCTGTAFPWEAYYSLNGEVKWTDNESGGGCAYNLGIRDGGW
ncbi:MAG: RICIN domain-containing protein [Verrucomicrobia bacterium]|nr:RICIN domain-containing protein [Verrucomicrobiota bacterium]